MCCWVCRVGRQAAHPKVVASPVRAHRVSTFGLSAAAQRTAGQTRSPLRIVVSDDPTPTPLDSPTASNTCAIRRGTWSASPTTWTTSQVRTALRNGPLRRHPCSPVSSRRRGDISASTTADCGGVLTGRVGRRNDGHPTRPDSRSCEVRREYRPVADRSRGRTCMPMCAPKFAPRLRRHAAPDR